MSLEALHHGRGEWHRSVQEIDASVKYFLELLSDVAKTDRTRDDDLFNLGDVLGRRGR